MSRSIEIRRITLAEPERVLEGVAAAGRARLEREFDVSAEALLPMIPSDVPHQRSWRVEWTWPSGPAASGTRGPVVLPASGTETSLEALPGPTAKS